MDYEELSAALEAILFASGDSVPAARIAQVLGAAVPIVETPSDRTAIVLGDSVWAREAGIDVPIVISGGSPSYPCHAKAGDGFLSPGTVFLWDWGYMTAFPDLPFRPGAVTA